MPTWEVIHGDCLKVLPTLAGIDAVITDPPYGIGHVKGSGGGAGAYRGSQKSAAESRHHQPIIGDDKPFDPSHLFGFKNLLMWGANHYAKRLPDYGRWLAWNKLEDIESFDSFSDVEFAWHSIGKASRIFNYMWKGGLACRKLGEDNGRRYHPTQKPVGLMMWCLEQAGIEPGATVLDPYVGVGSTGVACMRAGVNFIGIEIDADYCEIARKRIGAAAKQGRLELTA